MIIPTPSVEGGLKTPRNRIQPKREEQSSTLIGRIFKQIDVTCGTGSGATAAKIGVVALAVLMIIPGVIFAINFALINLKGSKLTYPLNIDAERLSKESLFSENVQPNAGIDDIAKLILTNYLSPSEAAKMMQVNTSWHSLIDKNDSIFVNRIFLGSCLAEAKQIAQTLKRDADLNDYSRYEVFFKIAKVEAQFDLSQAKLTAQKIKDPIYQSAAFTEIAKIQPKYFIQAKQAAQDIEDQDSSDRALLKIAVAEAQCDRNQARQTAESIRLPFARLLAVIEIGKIEAKHDFAKAQLDFLQARQISQNIQDENEEREEWSQIARVEAQYDRNQARQTVLKIRNPYIQESCFIEIGKNEAEHDLAKAQIDFETAKQLTESLNKIWQRESFNEVAGVLAKYDLNKAKQMINNIKSSFVKSQVFLGIARKDPKYCLIESKRAAQNIQCPNKRSRAVLGIVIVEAQYDINKAKQTSEDIADFDIKSRACFEIAIAEAQQILNRAKETSQNIKIPFYESEASQKVEIEIQHHINKAKSAAKKIQDHYYKTEAFIRIAKVDPQHDLSQAKQSAEKSGDECTVSTFCNIIKLEAQYDVIQAKQTALNFLSPECRAHALLEIVSA